MNDIYIDNYNHKNCSSIAAVISYNSDTEIFKNDNIIAINNIK